MTTSSNLFFGQGLAPRGDKSRFVVPAALRGKMIAASGGDSVMFVRKDPDNGCLIAFGRSRIAAFDAQIEAEQQRAADAGERFNYTARAKELFSFVEVGFDESGRFIMPEFLLKIAGATNHLYFQGNGRDVMIWAPEVLFAQDAFWDDTKISCQALLDELEAKAKRK